MTIACRSMWNLIPAAMTMRSCERQVLSLAAVAPGGSAGIGGPLDYHQRPESMMRDPVHAAQAAGQALPRPASAGT